jgi:hypothetical protein
LSGISPPPVADGSAVKVVNLSNAPGCRPERPIAARSRIDDSVLATGSAFQRSRSDGTTERLALG